MKHALLITDGDLRHILWSRVLVSKIKDDMTRKYVDTFAQVSWAYPEVVHKAARFLINDIKDIHKCVPYTPQRPINRQDYSDIYDTTIPIGIHTGYHASDFLAQAAGLSGAGMLMPFQRIPGRKRGLIQIKAKVRDVLKIQCERGIFIGLHLPKPRSIDDVSCLDVLRSIKWPSITCTVGHADKDDILLGVRDMRGRDLPTIRRGLEACCIVIGPGEHLVTHLAAALGRRVMGIWPSQEKAINEGLWAWGSMASDYCQPQPDHVSNWLQNALCAEGISNEKGDVQRTIFR